MGRFPNQDVMNGRSSAHSHPNFRASYLKGGLHTPLFCAVVCPGRRAQNEGPPPPLGTQRSHMSSKRYAAQSLKLPLTWRLVEEVRKIVTAFVGDQDRAFLDAAVMVAAEMVENVIKYGETMADENCGQVTVT